LEIIPIYTVEYSASAKTNKEKKGTKINMTIIVISEAIEI